MHKILTISLIIIALSSCKYQEIKSQKSSSNDQIQMLETMQKHLDAVSNRDLETLKSTLAPNNEMQLILPKAEIFNGTEAFIKYHKDWFALPNWTFETKILNSKLGRDLAMVIVEIFYREPFRDGKPYFNRMTVSYVLEKINGQWYVIKDHASSVEKSTDKN